MVKEGFQQRRELVGDTAKLDGATMQPDGTVSLEQSAELLQHQQAKANKESLPKIDKAAEKLAVAQALITEAREGSKGSHAAQGKEDEALQAAQKALNQLMPAAAGVVGGQLNGNGSADLASKTTASGRDVIDAAQMAAVSSVRVGTQTLAQRGEAIKLLKQGKDTFVKTSRENWTPERQERLFTRARKLAADLQANPDYRTSMIYFVDLIERVLPIKALIDGSAQGGKESKVDYAKRKLNAALGETAEPIIQFLDNVS